MSLDKIQFRSALSQFATGVVIITTRHAGQSIGLTVNSFNSVSLDPPLVLFSLDRRAKSLPAFLEAETFAVNVLGRHQQHLANQFARSLPDKWQSIDYRASHLSAVPLIDDAIAHLEGRRYAYHEAGDHIIYIGQVEDVNVMEQSVEPLIFFRSRYRQLHSEDWDGSAAATS